MIYTKEDFIDIDVESWVCFNEFQLAGSALFVKNGSVVSKLVQWATKNEKCDFNPSHVGSLVEMAGSIYVFDMKPPRASLVKLSDYIKSTKDDFQIVARDFDLDFRQFSANVIKRVNQFYGYISAIQSAYKLLYYPFKEHCSEIHLRELNNQGLFKEYSPNSTTPAKLHKILTGE